MGQFISITFVTLYCVFLGVLLAGMVSQKVRGKILSIISPVVSSVRRKLAEPRIRRIEKVAKESAWRLTDETWDIYADAVFEPVFWPLMLFVLFDHVRPIIDSWLNAPENIDLWKLLEAEMNANQILWAAFFAFFFMYFMIKLVRSVKEQRRTEEIKAAIADGNKQVVDKLSEISKQLADIREAIKR